MEQSEKPKKAPRSKARAFLTGLLAGQLLILLLDLGGGFLLRSFKGRVKVPIPLEAIVFIGMTAGIVLTALLIFFALGVRGLGWTFGKKDVGFFSAVGRGIRSTLQAAGALGLTLGIVGGTAWFMIPRAEWKPTVRFMDAQKERAVKWADGLRR